MSSDLPAGWRDTTWGEIAELAYGKALRERLEEGSVTVYGTNGPTGLTNRMLGRGPTVVIGRKGAYRGVHYADGPFWVIDTAFFLIPSACVEISWAYYELLTHDINGLDSGSAIPSTRREDFYAMPVRLPPLDEQLRIAYVLTILDDKIDSNRRLAALLEETAATLFRARFLDFVGEDEFEESEIGRIPRGWSAQRVDELASVNAASHTARTHPERIKYIDISSVAPRDIRDVKDVAFHDAPSRARRIARAGDTIVSTVRPERRAMAFIHDAPPNLTVSTGFAVVTPRSAAPTYVYRCVTSDACIDHLAASASGSAYPAVNPSILATWRVPVPPDLGREYEEFARPIESLRYALTAETVTLSVIRDQLLPRLISGELRVPDTTDPAEVIDSATEALAAAS